MGILALGQLPGSNIIHVDLDAPLCVCVCVCGRARAFRLLENEIVVNENRGIFLARKKTNGGILALASWLETTACV